jgi:hypothetical protein
MLGEEATRKQNDEPGTTCSDFIVIVILYAVIGLMAAAGAIFMARKNPRSHGRADLLCDVG